MSSRKPLAVMLLAIFAAAILFLVASLYNEISRQTRPTGETHPPTIASFERDGEIIDEFPVGSSVLQIPRRYAVRYSTPVNLNLVTHWPGLRASIDAGGLEPEDQINIIFQPRVLFATTGDREKSIQQYIQLKGLLGPEWDDGIGLFVYRDEKSRIQFLKSENYLTATGGTDTITCSATSDRTELGQKCRATYPLTDDLRIQYRFYSKHISAWRELDAEIRGFALSLIRYE